MRRSFVALAALYFLLLIPAPEPAAPAGANRTPFAWNRDAFWSSLETQLREARALDCDRLAPRIDSAISNLQRALDAIAAGRLAPENPGFGLLETNLFDLAPLAAACPKRLPEFARLFTRARDAVKRQSEHWEMNSVAARQTIYRLLYGGRAALEEILLQTPGQAVPALTAGPDEPSQTPSASVLGVTVHSGDILVSRGGAPTSALIARGNDFPGNFSHVALVHVDEQTRAASVIEAHIERGVVVSSFADYLADKKLRLMALRLRADLPQLIADPWLPHRAASLALRQATTRHIPYDFVMDYHDHTKQFCSEVASAAYEPYGITLWMGISRVSARGTVSWLSAFGVRQFETQEPSDLEYDPQLRVVAEWRDPRTLLQDHADNATTDVMLEDAEAGERLAYARLLLPFARLTKGYSAILNCLGKVGPVPEGMGAIAALRHKTFSRRHAAIRARLVELADDFKRQNGYAAPYWELIKLARKAKTEIRTKS